MPRRVKKPEPEEEAPVSPCSEPEPDDDLEASTPQAAVPRRTKQQHPTGSYVTVLWALSLVTVASLGGAGLWYGHTQLYQLRSALEVQQRKSDEAFSGHVTALRELDRAQQEIRRMLEQHRGAAAAPRKPVVAEEETGEDEEKKKKSLSTKRRASGESGDSEKEPEEDEEDEKKSKKRGGRRRRGRGR